jgi:hypothetical protein
VHKWLRKTPYALCRSCRGVWDLQLSYSPLGPLLFQNFGKNSIKGGQFEQFCPWRPRARRRTGVARHPLQRPSGPDAEASLCLLVRALWNRHAAPPSRPSPFAPRAPNPQAGRADHRRSPNGVAAVPLAHVVHMPRLGLPWRARLPLPTRLSI